MPSSGAIKVLLYLYHAIVFIDKKSFSESKCSYQQREIQWFLNCRPLLVVWLSVMLYTGV